MKKLKLKKIKPKKKNLRDIMDRDKPFTIFYSGVENDNYYGQVYNLGVRDFLMSYHYVEGKDLRSKLSGMSDVKLFIDSGAHTYQQDPKYADMTIEYWENRIKEYLVWAENNKDYLFCIVNFDFEHMIDGETVDRWNRQYFEPFMLKHEIPVCFVCHEGYSKMSFEDYCRRYPYVGFSPVNSEWGKFEEFEKALRIAEKHNCLIHGFGMTQTSILPKLPFYSVDSTSWKTGLRYGLFNVWTGKKVRSFKKEEWLRAEKYISQYKDVDIDMDKLQAYDEEEVIVSSVYAYQKAEEYIRECLKPLTYWHKPQIENKDSLDDVEFPSVEWIESPEATGLEKYAKNLNINPEHSDKTWLRDAVIDCTVFCNKDRSSEFEDIFNKCYLQAENMILDLHEHYLNSVCANDEERVEELTKFFTEAVLGKSDKLLLAGTNFDREVQEREKYIEEEEYEYEDLSEEEIKGRLSNLLSEKSGEIDDIEELEDEIYNSVGIEPVRDKQGKFLKGQTKVRKPKNIYSDKYPKMACDRCYASQKCVEYEAGKACAYNKMFKRFNTRNMEDLIDAMQSMVSLNLERMQRVAMFEILDGGLPDGNLTSFIDQNTRLINSLKHLYDTEGLEELRHTKVYRSDGTQVETTKVSNPQSGGILEKLFSMNTPKKEGEEVEEKEDKIIEVEVKEAKEEDK